MTCDEQAPSHNNKISIYSNRIPIHGPKVCGTHNKSYRSILTSVTFVRILPRIAVAIRVFVNRHAIAKSLTAMNQDSEDAFQTVVAVDKTLRLMVRLQRSVKVRLSESDMARVVSLFKDLFWEILFKMDQEGGKVVNYDDSAKASLTVKDVLLVPLAAEGWKVEVRVSKSHLAVVRGALSGEYVEIRPEDRYGMYLKLVQKHTHFEFIVPREEMEELKLALEEEDDKKATGTLTYSCIETVFRGLDVYIMRRP